MGESIIYADDSLLVVEKPAGLLAVPGRGPDKQECLARRVMDEFPDALIVHRLDMATSGLMLFARGREMQRVLSQRFMDRQVEKNYEAVVEGRPEDCGEIDLPLSADWPNRPRQKVDGSGKSALTRFRMLACDTATDTSRVELKPVTGRTHQLRVHLAAIGHAILGDALYGERPAPRLMLHASHLAFVHPQSRKAMEFTSAPQF